MALRRLATKPWQLGLKSGPFKLTHYRGPSLLGTYEDERRPVHQRVIRGAETNYATVGNQLVRPLIEAPGPEGEAARHEVGGEILRTKWREFRTLGVVLGCHYAGSPIVVPDGQPPPPEHPSDYVPSAVPGCLAPHAWLADGSSLYDHFGPGYTLLVMNGCSTGADAVAQAAAARGMPLAVVAPGDERLPDAYAARFALIRPDQHVAWRGDALPDDAGPLLDRVTGRG